MYRTCAHPHCDVGFDRCRIHHVTHWEHHGTTNLANLLPLCDRHHHLVHEGGWTLTLTPERTITLHQPDNTMWFHGPTTNRTRRRGDDSATVSDPPPLNDSHSVGQVATARDTSVSVPQSILAMFGEALEHQIAAFKTAEHCATRGTHVDITALTPDTPTSQTNQHGRSPPK